MYCSLRTRRTRITGWWYGSEASKETDSMMDKRVWMKPSSTDAAVKGQVYQLGCERKEDILQRSSHVSRCIRDISYMSSRRRRCSSICSPFPQVWMSSTRRGKAPSSCIISKISSLVRPSCNKKVAIIWSVGASSSYDKPLATFLSHRSCLLVYLKQSV